LESEDCLYELISLFISKNVNYSKLLECIGYEYLSRCLIESFIDLISESFELLAINIWNRLRSRLIFGGCSSMSSRIHSLIFPYREGSPFDGIISFLTRTHGGNICDLDIVSITSSSAHSSRIAKNVVDFDSSSLAQTDSNPNSWICYDFKTKSVNVKHYSLRSRSDFDGHHPMNWTLEGSVDGTEMDGT
jgi:hypothetical protein